MAHPFAPIGQLSPAPMMRPTQNLFTNPTPTVGPYTAPQVNALDHRIEEYKDVIKDAFCKMQQQIDDNESELSKGEATLNQISEENIILHGKVRSLFNMAKKIRWRQLRFEKALQMRQNFEHKVARYVRELMRLCQLVNSADSYNKMQSPGGMLSEILSDCESRLQEIEKIVQDFQELIRTEAEPNDLQLLVRTLRMINDKFQIVSALACDVHAKIQSFASGVSLVSEEMDEDFPHDNIYSGTWELDPRSNALNIQVERHRSTDRASSQSTIRDAITGKSRNPLF